MKKLIFFLLVASVLSAENDSENRLNERLNQLFVLEEKNPSAPLFVDISQTFFQLNQYAWSLLWAERALKWQPGNGKALHLKELSLEKLFLKKREVSSFEPLISLDTALIWFLVLFALTFLSTSLYLWMKNQRILYFSVVSFIISLFLLLFAVQIQYFSPIQAVIIHPTALYQGMGFDYRLVSDRVLVSGLKVGVAQTGKNGEWLKIQTSDGMIGFIPLRAIRVI